MPNGHLNRGIVRVDSLVGTFQGFANDVITDHLIDFGAHTRNELAMVLAEIEESDVCIDFGAHIGTFAVPVARKAGPLGRLLAIEGSPAAFDLLQINIAQNGLADRIEPICAIAGFGDGQVLRRVEVDGHTGASHYISDEVADLHVQDAYALVCAKGFERPTFIKIDVEGMELLVLRSLEPLISQHRPKLYIEINQETFTRCGVTYAMMEEFLSSYGYEFFRNIGERNSGNDRFTKTKLGNLSEGGKFYDLLALPG